ncbi:MAG: hypothetical protein PF638_13145 [Candidatus Delongbacteria bacterium]|nr:hypothetical protein [Candidatus Delongbacteria bacterium]
MKTKKWRKKMENMLKFEVVSMEQIENGLTDVKTDTDVAGAGTNGFFCSCDCSTKKKDSSE